MSKKKVLKMIIEGTCDKCPYLEYDGSYSMSSDSGYDCTHPDTYRRIVDDGIISNYHKKLKEIKESKQTFFPKSDDLKNPLNIPEWCPLKDFDSKEKGE